MKLDNLTYLFALLIGLLLPPAVRAENIPPRETPTGIERIFKQHGYTNYLLPPEYNYPELFVQTFPTDFSTIKSENQRHKFFLMILLPLALETNRKIEIERRVITYLEHKHLSGKLDTSDSEIIENLGRKYDIFTRLPPPGRTERILTELKTKVDIIPPSVLLASAAINTGWGEAGFLEKSNNLYKELVWNTNEGLKPTEETKDDSYRIKIYPSLAASMEAYALKLNSSVDYQEFRDARQNLRYRNSTVDGRFLAPYLILASPLPNFAGLLDYTITFYRLNELDKYARLAEKPSQSRTTPSNVTKN